MNNRKIVFTHETTDDFTERYLEVVRNTDSNGDTYLINVHETFEKDINGETESLSSIDLTHDEMLRLFAQLRESLKTYNGRNR